MEDVGNWLLYAAMIVIAFISWVFNKIQEATAARQRQKEIEEYRRHHGRDPEPFDDDEDEWEAFEEPEQSREPTAAEDAMRKLVEALGGNVIEPPPPPPSQEVPEPAPKPPPLVTQSEVEPAATRLSAQEKAALERVRQREHAIRKKRRRHASGTLADLSAADLVRDPDGIRKAVILREILDKPRAERPWDFS